MARNTPLTPAQRLKIARAGHVIGARLNTELRSIHNAAAAAHARARHATRLATKRALQNKELSLLNKLLKKGRNARQTELARRRRLIMNLNTNIAQLKSIIGPFNGHRNLGLKITAMQGSPAYRNVRPDVIVLAQSVYKRLLNQNQKKAERANRENAEIRAQIAKLQAQLNAVRTGRPQVLTQAQMNSQWNSIAKLATGVSHGVSRLG